MMESTTTSRRDTTGNARDRILRAAEALFAEKGYAATSCQEICAAAQVNKALLYYYFEDKHDLYVSLINSGIAEFRAVMNAALAAPGTHPERLARFVRDHVALVWERSTLLRVVHRCLMAGEQEEVRLVEQFRESLLPLERFFAEAVTAGAFRSIDPAMAARSLLGQVDVFAFCEIYQERTFTQDEVAAHVTDLLLRGLGVTRAAL